LSDKCPGLVNNTGFKLMLPLVATTYIAHRARIICLTRPLPPTLARRVRASCLPPSRLRLTLYSAVHMYHAWRGHSGHPRT
jgi:hypothetical protein